MRALFALSFFLVACGDRQTSPASQGTEHRTAEVAPQTEVPAATVAPDIERARIDSVLESWLAAQNAGRFADYSALYATRFQGVRRTGEKVKRFDRAGWLADRERMFARPMQVTMSEVEISSTPTSASVRFVQSFTSGSFSDAGPKRIQLVREGSALKIANEEMLASRPLRGVEATIPGGLFPTLDLREGALVILGPATEAQASGRPRLLHTVDTSQYASLRAAASTVPSTARAMVGKSIRLVSRTTTCETTITSLGVVVVAVPHSETAHAWRGGDEGGARSSAAEIALAVLDLAEERWLVGVTSSRCGETFAAVPTTETPALYAARAGTPATVAEVLGKIRAGARGAELVTAMREGMVDEGGEETEITDAAVNDAVASNLQVIEHTRESATIVVAKVSIPGACGGSIETFVFERVGSVLVSRTLGVADITVVFDATGDGIPEGAALSDWGTRSSIVRFGDHAETVTEWSFPYLDCGC